MDPVSDTEFIEKYRRLCGHIAWDFVKRSHRDVSPIALSQEDAEDFASCALIKLLKCPAQHRGNKWYVQRVIENAITTAWRKRLKQLGLEREVQTVRSELDIPAPANRHGASSDGGDLMDMLPGPDGLAGKTQIKFDFAKVIALLPTLPNSERVVVELTFGLNGAEPFTRKRIAKKLGRTEWWAETKLRTAILRMRAQISSQAPVLFVS